MSRITDWLTSRWRLITAALAPQTDVFPHQADFGIGNEWANPDHADYYTRSVPIFTAVNTRATSMSLIPWNVSQRNSDGSLTSLGPEHPAQQILDHPNPWFSGAELRRATETFLCLYGRAFWTIEQAEDGTGRPELWPVNPSRMTVLPGTGQNGPYIRGYIYRGLNGREQAYLPEEVEFWRFFNPIQDRTGLSPVAPLRRSADMGLDAVLFNRNTLRNSGIPDYILMGDEEMTDAQIDAFYVRWEARFAGPTKSNRPAITSNVKDIKALAFNNRDLQWVESLRWTLQEAGRVFNVPTTMMGDLADATLANVASLEKGFWTNTIKPEANMFSERITHSTLPRLGFTGLEVNFDYTDIEAINEGAEQRNTREMDSLDRGLLTINEIRRTYNLQDVPWGNVPYQRQREPGTVPPNQRDRPQDV